MTTREIEIIRSDEIVFVGQQKIAVNAASVTCGGFTWTLYVSASGNWYEGCGNCDGDSGNKPWFSHVHGGVCFQCGGAGVSRLGTFEGMKKKIRSRVSGRLSTRNAIERAAERDRAAAEAWMLAHPNLASDLARERAYGSGHGPLISIAIQSRERVISAKQVALATLLLVERAWEEAHVIEAPEDTSTFAGEIGETVTLTGTISVAHYLPSSRWDRSASVLIVVDARNAEGRQVLLKTVTASKWAFMAEKGDPITLAGIVKEHDDSEFGKQTVLRLPKRLDK